MSDSLARVAKHQWRVLLHCMTDTAVTFSVPVEVMAADLQSAMSNAIQNALKNGAVISLFGGAEPMPVPVVIAIPLEAQQASSVALASEMPGAKFRH